MEKMTEYVVLLIICVLGFIDAEVLMSVMKGDSVSLNTNVTKQPRDTVLWYLNDTLIAQINGEANNSCFYDGKGGIFRDRLKLEVDYKTGSLTIRDITSEHAGRYEANFIQIRSSGTSQSLNRKNEKKKCDSTKITKKESNIGDIIKTFIVSVSDYPEESGKGRTEQDSEKSKVPDSGLSSGAVAGIVVVVLLVFAAAGVIYYCYRSSRNADILRNNKTNNEEVV